MPVINKYHHGGRVPPGSVNIMRGTPFGNPFVIGVHGTRDEVISKYRAWLWDKVRNDTSFAGQVRALRGQSLCCCCAPAARHGDVLERAAEWLASIN